MIAVVYYLAKLQKYFTNLDFPERRGFPFLSYLRGEVVWGRYSLIRYYSSIRMYQLSLLSWYISILKLGIIVNILTSMTVVLANIMMRSWCLWPMMMTRVESNYTSKQKIRFIIIYLITAWGNHESGQKSCDWIIPVVPVRFSKL